MNLDRLIKIEIKKKSHIALPIIIPIHMMGKKVFSLSVYSYLVAKKDRSLPSTTKTANLARQTSINFVIPSCTQTA